MPLKAFDLSDNFYSNSISFKSSWVLAENLGVGVTDSDDFDVSSSVNSSIFISWFKIGAAFFFCFNFLRISSVELEKLPYNGFFNLEAPIFI